MLGLIAVSFGSLGFWLGYIVGKSAKRESTISVDENGNINVSGGSVNVKMPKGKATVVDMTDPLSIDLGENDQPKKHERV